MRRLTPAFFVWLTALAVATGLALIVDGASHPLDAVASLLALPGHDPLLAALIHNLRLPRVMAAAASGALLASAGAGVQLLFRNPLAEPGLIGVSGGAALAAALALSLGLTSTTATLISFCGGMGALWLAHRLCGPDLSSSRLILAGAAINALAGSLLTLLITTLPDGSLRTILFWLMGSFAGADWPQAGALWALLLPTTWLLFSQAPFLNALQLGEAAAFHSGFDTRRQRTTVAVLTAFITALVVASVGMVSFVGLLGPHLARLMVGAEARRLLPLAPLAGAVLTVLADWLARLLIVPGELPVSVLTSLIGAPFFLWLLWRQPRAEASHAGT